MVLTRAECAVVTFLVMIQRAGGDAVNESEASGAGDHAEARGLPYFCVGASSRREINPLAVLLTSGMTRGIVLHTETGKCDKWDASQGNPPQHPESRDKKKTFLVVVKRYQRKHGTAHHRGLHHEDHQKQKATKDYIPLLGVTPASSPRFSSEPVNERER